MTTTATRREVPGTVLYETAEDVRVALAALRIPEPVDLLAEWAASSEGAVGSHGVDVDVDADLPLPAHCLTQWSAAHGLTDRLRAIDMLHHARLGLSRVLRDDASVRRLGVILRRGALCQTEDDADACTGDEENAFGEREPDSVPPMEQVETLVRPEDHLSFNATLKTRLGTARRETGRALAAFLGTPRLLECAVEGSIRFNKVERLLTRVIAARLTVRQMNGVDEFAAQLDPSRSLDQFDKKVREFIHTFMEPPAPTQESIAALRGVEFQKYPDGWGELRAFGPAVDLEALYQRVRATSRAIARNELEALTVTSVEGEGPIDAGGRGANSAVVGSQHDALLSVDERRIGHLMFDTLSGAVPQTEVRVVRASGAPAVRTTDTDPYARGVEVRETNAGTHEADAGRHEADAGILETDEFVVTVACPTSGTWLRRQAAVTVTMSLATLTGLGDDPATLGLSTPLPAQHARRVAAHSTVWRRMLFDPVTGAVKDEATRNYRPTASMRRAVEQKWRTCTAPGCTRNAERCEIDHCEPFLHEDPGRGGRTHPDNLIPLCVLHHQLKTEGVIRLRRAGPNEVEWVLPLGVVTRTRAPSAVTDGRRDSLLMEQLGVRLRSPHFDGTIVQEVLRDGEPVPVVDHVDGHRGRWVVSLAGQDRDCESASSGDSTASVEEAADSTGETAAPADDGKRRRGDPMEDDPPPF